MLVLVLVSSLVLSGCQINTAQNGSHTGYVTAIQQNGIFFKKYSVYFKTDKTSSQEDVYCIDRDSDLNIEKLKDLQRSGKKATLYYNSRVKFLAPNHCEDYYLIDFKEEI